MTRPRFSRSAASARRSIAISAKSTRSPTPFRSKPARCAQAIWPPAIASGAGRLRCEAFICSRLRSSSSASSPRLSRSRSPLPRLRTTFALNTSRIFLHIAESVENQLATRTHRREPVASLLHRIDASPARIEAEFSERERALMRLTRTIAQLVDRLQNDVASEGLYDVPTV